MSCLVPRMYRLFHVHPLAWTYWVLMTTYLLLYTSSTFAVPRNPILTAAPVVSIEDSIDLDGASSSQQARQINRLGASVQIVKIPGPSVVSHFKEPHNDDEDLNSGSGSGAEDINSINQTEGNLTLTSNRHSHHFNKTRLDRNNDTSYGDAIVKVVQNTTQSNLTFDLDHTFDDIDKDESSELDEEEEEDPGFRLQGTLTVTSNHVLNPPSWTDWSDWVPVTLSTKVRARTCHVEGEVTSSVACPGTGLQVSTCDVINSTTCWQTREVRTAGDTCPDSSQNVPAHSPHLVKAAPVSRPDPSPLTKSLPLGPSDHEVCRYSLFDYTRRKYVFVGWNLTELVTKGKVKKWCDRSAEQYLMMTSPRGPCRKYYQDLCKATERCRADKPARERGDFAEGCWRNLVYGDMLPVGLSNKQTIVYFICQRFAAQSKLGRIFGYKQTFFGTLYNTDLRSPTLSLNKIITLGDITWPHTEYFIENGLVEADADVLWLLSKPKKGMVTLHDLGKCRDDVGCELGLRQALPSDYSDWEKSGYSPTHLMWPELMTSEPESKLSTFTVTNIAPLHSQLYPEWQDAILKVRQFAIDQCGVPVVTDVTGTHQTELSSHRANKSALYVTSGVLPSKDTSHTVGRDTPIPSMFWLAGCCVQQHITFSPSPGQPATLTQNSSTPWGDTYIVDQTTNISGFSLYIVNSEGNHVISGPILQLEMLLQDMYKSSAWDPDVTLFPGFQSACSDLKNDVSHWFQK